MEDKYMRVSRIILRNLGIDVDTNPIMVSNIADVMQHELERPVPLLPNVRYKNTKENIARIDKNQFYNLWCNGGSIYVGFYNVNSWHIYKGNEIYVSEVICFSLIPTGDIQDE